MDPKICPAGEIDELANRKRENLITPAKQNLLYGPPIIFLQKIIARQSFHSEDFWFA